MQLFTNKNLFKHLIYIKKMKLNHFCSLNLYYYYYYYYYQLLLLLLVVVVVFIIIKFNNYDYDYLI